MALLQAGAAGADEADHRRAGVAGHPQGADDRVGVDFAEAAAEEGRVLRVTEDRPAVDFPGTGGDAVAGGRPLAEAHAADAAAQRPEAARVAEHPQLAERRVGGCGGRGLEGSGHNWVRSGHLVGGEGEDGVVAAEAERVGDRDDGAVSVDNRFS